MEKNKAYFPLFVDLSEKRVLVVGGGKIATRRIRTLVLFCSRIKVVAPEISEEISDFAESTRQKSVVCEKRKFMPADLEQADLVLVATDDPVADEEVYTLCKQMNIPVNVASDKSKCDFYFPAIVQNENMVVGMTSSGEAHKQVREMREKIEKILSERKADL